MLIMNAFRASFIGLLFLSFAGLLAVAQTPVSKSTASSKAIVVLHPTAGNKVTGVVTFTPVADGVRIYSYIPEDKQVVVSPQPRDAETTTPALFLAGKGNLTRDFTPSLVDNPAGTPPGSRSLKLVPRTRQPDYDWLVFTLDPATLAIRGLLTMDAQGGESAFIFTNLKENTGLADKEFAFSIPRGVDVVTDSSR